MNIFVEEPHLFPPRPSFMNKIKSSISVITQTVTEYVRPSFGISKEPESRESGLWESKFNEQDENLSIDENKSYSETLNDKISYERTSLLKKGEKKEVINLTKVLNTVEDYKNGFMPDLECYDEVKKFPMRCFEISEMNVPLRQIRGCEKIADGKGLFEAIKEKEDRKRRRELIKNRFLMDLENDKIFEKESKKFLEAQEKEDKISIGKILKIKENQPVSIEPISEYKDEEPEIKRKHIVKTTKKSKPIAIPLESVIKLTEENIIKKKTHKFEKEQSKVNEEHKNNETNLETHQNETQTLKEINGELSKLKSAIQDFNELKKESIQASNQVNAKILENETKKEIKIDQEDSLLPLTHTIKKFDSNSISREDSECKSEGVINQIKLKEPSEKPNPSTETLSTNPFLMATSGLNLKDLITNGFKNPMNQMQNQNHNFVQNPIKIKNSSDEYVKSDSNLNVNQEQNNEIHNKQHHFQANSSSLSFAKINNNNSYQNHEGGEFNFSKIAQQFTNSLNSTSLGETQFSQYPNSLNQPQNFQNQNFFPQYNPQNTETNFQFQSHLQPQATPQSYFEMTQAKFDYNPQPLLNNQSNMKATNLFIDSSKPSLFEEPVSRTEKKTKGRGHRGGKERIQ